MPFYLFYYFLLASGSSWSLLFSSERFTVSCLRSCSILYLNNGTHYSFGLGRLSMFTLSSYFLLANEHLTGSCILAMLNLFAASRHNDYAKWQRICTTNLCNTHAILHKQFMRGNHTIRRPGRLWAGLSSDLVIEQTPMKWAEVAWLEDGECMTVIGTHGCASIHLTMSHVTGLLSQNLEHSTIGWARIGRDTKDLQKVKEYLVDSNPFRFFDADNLISLQSGVIAVPSDNVKYWRNYS